MADITMATEIKHIAKVGTRYHPHYAEKSDLWNFLLASWRGGLGMSYRAGMTEQEARDLDVSGYYPGLFRFSREPLIDYCRRVAMSMYTPLARQIVEEYVRYVTKDEPERTGAEKYAELINDVDRTGRDMTVFVRDALALAQVMGEVGILVDMPSSDKELVSKADAMASGIRAYAGVVMPQNIVDWSIGRDGKYEWLIIETTELVNDISDDGAYKKTIRTYYDKEIWQRYSSTKETGDRKAQEWQCDGGDYHPCKETPVIRVVMSDVDSNALTPESWFYDLADINRTFYNLDSLDVANLYYQTYGILVLPPATNDETVLLSRSHALTEGENEKGITRFVQTTGAAGESFDRKINELKTRMYMIAGLQYQTGKAVPESGISKQWDFQRVNQFLAGLAKTANFIERRISQLAGLWQGTGEGYEVAYPSDYSVQELSQTVEGVLGIKTIGFSSETGRKESLKHLYREVLPDLSEDVLNQIDSEIEASEEVDPLAGYDIRPEGEQQLPVT